MLIYITCSSKKEAEKISMRLLEKRLIACSNMFPVRSMYRWKNKIEKSSEHAIIAKAKEQNYNRIQSEVRKIHSYEIPCILGIKSAANREFMRWVEKETV